MQIRSCKQTETGYDHLHKWRQPGLSSIHKEFHSRHNILHDQPHGYDLQHKHRHINRGIATRHGPYVSLAA
jgi:hypothetical protein